jgi:hypothetical protein
MTWQQRPRKKELAPEDASSVVREDEPARVVVCAHCEARIAAADAKIDIDGRHRHTCVNPAGVVYRIACYREAPGAARQGEPSTYFSWFAGCAWQVLVCARCGVHLGWAFSGAADFAGLIADRVIEREV